MTAAPGGDGSPPEFFKDTTMKYYYNAVANAIAAAHKRVFGPSKKDQLKAAQKQAQDYRCKIETHRNTIIGLEKQRAQFIEAEFKVLDDERARQLLGQLDETIKRMKDTLHEMQVAAAEHRVMVTILEATYNLDHL